MGLGSTFWNAAGDGVRWMHDWDGYTDYISVVPGDPYVVVYLYNVKMFQLPFSVKGGYGEGETAPQVDAGYFFWATAAGYPLSYSSLHASVGRGGNTGTYTKPAWKEIHYTSSSKMLNSDIPPKYNAAIDGVDYYSGIAQTGFIFKVPFDNMSGAENITAIIWAMLPTAGTRKLYHYNPWAWFGTVPAVVADIVMKCGMSKDYIDQTAFDHAYDAYDLTTGDAPWTTASGLATKFEIGCSRRVGEKCIDLVLECARHTRDMYFVNESGKLSVNSFTRWAAGGNFQIGLTVTDGIVGVSQWGYETRYMYTKALASWGSGVVVSGNPYGDDPNTSVFSASEDETMSAYPGSGLADYIYHDEFLLPRDLKYGERWFKGREVIQNKSGQPRMAQKAHFPFLFSPHNTAGTFVPLRYWFLSDSQPRRFLEITQDMRALNWGVGSHVTGVAVTDDGQTISNSWCIKRTYDFNRLTVTSVLMEQPPNT